MKAYLLAALLAVHVVPAGAQTAYPERPIKLVVGFPPGGGADSIARVVTDSMSRILGQAIIVENKPGATTTIAGEQVARSAPDGYTLFLANAFNYGTDKVVLKSVRYDAARDFTPISQWAVAPMLLVVTSGLEAKNVTQLVDLARKNPGKFFYASSGAGGIGHLAGVYFNQLSNTSMVHVPFKGGPQVSQAVAAGEVQLSFASIPGAKPMIATGKMRALAVTSEKRSSLMSDLPTVAEFGMPGFDLSVTFGLVGPANLPPAIVAKLHAASLRALSEPDVIEKLARLGNEASPSSSPEEFKAWLIKEGAKHAALARQSGASME